MPAVAKAGVDWASIEIGYRGAEKIAHLAARYGITRQAIQNRAKRHGWMVTASAEALVSTATAERLREPETAADRRIIANGQRTLANMETVLEVLMEGGSVRLAAQRIGMAASTLRDWMEGDQDFARMAVAAEAEAGIRALEQVSSAGARGEWKASAYLLERMRATREDFAPVPAGVAAIPGVPELLIVFKERHLVERMAQRCMEHPGPARFFVENSDGTREEVQAKGNPRPAAPSLEHFPDEGAEP